MPRRPTWQRLAVAAAALLPVLALTAPPARADTTTSLDGTAMIHFGGGKGESFSAPHYGLYKNACEPDRFCGSGRFRDLGVALVYLDGDSYGDPVSPTCVAFEKDELIAAPDGSWGIATHGTGTACFPDAPQQAPPFTDFGNPGVYETTFEVVDSWGVFAGATGSGHETFSVAGDEGLWRVTGSVVTPG